ncbi:MAG: flagellar basal body rod protein FlgB [Oscillospiraceae bacterium]
MLFDSLDFKAMEASLGALNTKQQVITQNLANIDTPGYKTQEVSFQDLLNEELDKDIRNKNDYAFETKIIQTEDTYFNPDGNNVDADKESLELYSTYLQSAYIIQKMNSTIGNYQYVLTNANFR